MAAAVARAQQPPLDLAGPLPGLPASSPNVPSPPVTGFVQPSGSFVSSMPAGRGP